MNDQYHRLMRKVAELDRIVGRMCMQGTIKEIKGDKLVLSLGKDKDGKEILSPEVTTGNTMYGKERERRAWKVGQNAWMFCIGGDMMQSFVMPGTRNRNNLAPDHASKDGKDEYTWQMDKLRVKKTIDSKTGKAKYLIWTQPPKSAKGAPKMGSGTYGSGEGSASDEDEQETKSSDEPDPDTADSKAEQVIALTDDHIFMRYGTSGSTQTTVTLNSSGGKMSTGDNHVTTMADKVIVDAGQGNLYVATAGQFDISPPPRLGRFGKSPINTGSIG